MSPWRVVRHRALGRGSASGSLARFELSAQARRRSEDLAPAASTTSERSAMLAHPSTELVARAPCQLRRAHARSVRAVRARLRQQRRLEVDKTRKRGVQTGGPRGAPSRGDDHAGTFSMALPSRAEMGTKLGWVINWWLVG